MPYPKNEGRLKDWEHGLWDALAKDPDPWNKYDGQMRSVIGTYNQHLANTAGYMAPDYKKVKAMVWTETGANSDAWDTAPMQIGVNGDPGLHELLTSEQGKRILPPTYAMLLNEANVPKIGNLNIAAGIGYLLKILARFDYVESALSLFESSSTSPSHEQSDPNLILSSSFSGNSGTTAFTPAQKSHHLAPKKRIDVVGWRAFDFDFIARHYNVGDGNYPGKLQYAYDIICGTVNPVRSHK